MTDAHSVYFEAWGSPEEMLRLSHKLARLARKTPAASINGRRTSEPDWMKEPAHEREAT